MSGQNIGMMDQGYFVPRREIINWINDLLKLDITKIEQFGSGAIYCQIFDVLFPGKLPVSKINWKAKHDYQFVGNLKLLQSGFDKVGIKRHVEIERLCKAKYQDNLEFIQWMKRYFDLNGGGRSEEYDAEARRGHLPTDFSFAEKMIVKKTFNGYGVASLKEETENNRNKVNLNASKANNKSIVAQKQAKKCVPEQSLQQKLNRMELQLLQITNIVSSKETSSSKVEKIQQLVEIHN